MRYILLLLCCLCFVNCQERRRRIKKKIIVQNEDTTPESQNSQQKDLVTEANQKPKEPRGFLDDYYKQFEGRTEKVSTIDQMAQESVAQPSVTPDQAISSERRQDVSDYDLETLMLREQQLQELLARESELTPAQREELLRQLAAWPGVPDSLPDNSLHTTNSIHNLVDPTRNDVQVSTSDYHRFKKHSRLMLLMSQDSSPTCCRAASATQSSHPRSLTTQILMKEQPLINIIKLEVQINFSVLLPQPVRTYNLASHSPYHSCQFLSPLSIL